jgi:hypothetical protein
LGVSENQYNSLPVKIIKKAIEDKKELPTIKKIKKLE